MESLDHNPKSTEAATRWSAIGVMMRGQSRLSARTDLLEGVREAIATEAAEPSKSKVVALASRRRVRRWALPATGLAAAASLAIAAVVVPAAWQAGSPAGTVQEAAPAGGSANVASVSPLQSGVAQARLEERPAGLRVGNRDSAVLPSPQSMMRATVAILLALAATSGFSSDDDGDPAKLLVRMSEAVRQTTYAGTVVYQSDTRMESLRVIHEYRDGSVRERLVSLTGDAREIYRNNEEVICVLPQQRMVTIDQRAHQAASLLPSLRRDNIGSLNDRYDFQHLGDERIAGRLSVGVLVSPRDDMRYGYEYWLDRETHL
eukprot:Cvel_36180.t1-p1 / transcript=Cvel_36180.t1 / gene=Cvel_36180 / organism=Chromera_velia_CCMP2878 / gene_product=Sigma factor AlgU regulatory protein MucB, putative / transcript_product=Sigma factor AlgU regulatory protein MucB, putative / location=Cvel_scaffold7008:1224-2291(+) / protein_length=317 / sequence_SO=supercontig / SO=protein_coding / is_pseudo=false